MCVGSHSARNTMFLLVLFLFNRSFVASAQILVDFAIDITALSAHGLKPVCLIGVDTSIAMDSR